MTVTIGEATITCPECGFAVVGTMATNTCRFFYACLSGDKLLEPRPQLPNLNTYMDGKAGAEKLISQAINDPALLQSLVSAPKPGDAGKDGE